MNDQLFTLVVHLPTKHTTYRRNLYLLLSFYVYWPELAILRKILFVLYQSRALSQYFTTTFNTSKAQ